MNLFIFNHSKSIGILDNWIYPVTDHARSKQSKQWKTDHASKMNTKHWNWIFLNSTKTIFWCVYKTTNDQICQKWDTEMRQPKWIFLHSIIQNLLYWNIESIHTTWPENQITLLKNYSLSVGPKLWIQATVLVNKKDVLFWNKLFYTSPLFCFCVFFSFFRHLQAIGDYFKLAETHFEGLKLIAGDEIKTVEIIVTTE